MQRKIIITADGSTTIAVPALKEHYHSTHGAIQEAMHVYIENGFNFINKDVISVLEIGFGTGLNCLLTCLNNTKKVNYVGIEAYPVTNTQIAQLNYTEQLENTKAKNIFTKIHTVNWEEKQEITPNFILEKQQKFFSEITATNAYDIIYFDAFAPEKQPDLWTVEIFKRMYTALKPEGILVTYASKGTVKRAIRAAGFSLKRLPGPVGKWHMLRAIKDDASL